MKNIDKYYNFLSVFDSCQELAVLAIRDLAGCKFRTAKIRTIITNVRFEGANENFSEVEPFIDKILNMVECGFDISEWMNIDKYRDVTDDELFKIEEIDDDGLKRFEEELYVLDLPKKAFEYLYFRECSLKEKANKEIVRLKDRNSEIKNKIVNRDKEISRLKLKVKELESRTYVHATLF